MMIPSETLSMLEQESRDRRAALLQENATLQQRVQQLEEALEALAHAVFGAGHDSEPDVYADYDKLCELERFVSAALYPAPKEKS